MIVSLFCPLFFVMAILQNGILTFGDLGGAVGRVDEDVAALRTEGRGDGLSKSVNTLEKAGTSLNTELELLVAISKRNWKWRRNPRNTTPKIGIDSSTINWSVNIPCEQNAVAAGSGLSG